MNGARASAAARAGAGLAGLAVALGAGCATHVKPSTGANAPAAPGVPATLAELARAAQEQRQRPVPEARLLPAPPALTAEAGASLSPATTEKARASLESVLADLARAPVPKPPERPALEEQRASDATRHYIAGRQKSLEGDQAGAIRELRAALDIDPGAGEAWRELAEAQLAGGAKTDAGESLKRAEAAGVRDGRVLELLGRIAAERGDHQEAVRWLARALGADPEQADPLLAPVLEYELARSLSELGYHAAAKDSLVRLLARAPAMTASTRYMQEFGAIFRRQGELWREVGDDEMRLGDPEAALAAYEQAVRLPTLDGQSAMPRLVYAAMRAGRPAAAGLAVVQRILEAGGRLSPEDLGLLAHIARVEASRRQLVTSLGQLRASLGAAAPTLSADLARAQAAVAPPVEARRILAEHMERHPGDVEASALLARLAEDPAGAARMAAAVAGTQPASAGALAEGILRSELDADAAADALRAQSGVGARLVATMLDLKRGYFARAAGLAASAPLAASATPAVAVARAESGLAAGRTDLALAALRQLNGTDAATSRARGRILALFQRDREALDAMAPVLASPATDPDQRLEDLIVGAQLAARMRRIDDTERWLRAAAAIDPGDDRALGYLLNLYDPSGAKPDAAKQAQVVRELRQDHPDGRVLRLARATEMAKRSLWGPAEREASQLALEAPGERGPIEVLTAVWSAKARGRNRDAVREGIAWLDGAMARRPLDPLLMACKITLMVAGDRSEEAEIVLRQALSQGAGPDVSRLLERLLRDHLRRPEEASSLALARLENRERTMAESLELAEVYTRADRAAEASRTLLGAMTPDLTLQQEQKLRIVVVAATSGQQALKLRGAKKPDPEAEGAALRVIELVMAQSDTMPPEVHEIRLLLKAAASDASAPDLLAACDEATRQQPKLGMDPVKREIGVLVQVGKSPIAREIIESVIQRPGVDAVDLYKGWFQAIAVFGAASDLRALIESAEHADKLHDVVDQLRQGTEGEVTDYKAEAAYVLGNFYTSLKREDEANKAFELALEYQPTHGWAANNLGYYLADKGGDIERAAALLEKAVAQLPNEPAVVDSLGWVRYKQGVIDDERDADTGEVKQRGAVSLLQSAAATEHGQQDPTILNHLGDALWVAGRKSDAQRYWTLAQATATQLLNIRQPIVPSRRPPVADKPEARPATPETAGDAEETVLAAEYRSIAESCAQKRSGAASGGPVKVAPQVGNENPQPRSTLDPAPATPSDTASAKAPATPGERKQQE